MGCSVIVISSEMPEIIGLCDDVIVMREGKDMGMVSIDDITEHNLIMMATGKVYENKDKSIGGKCVD